jgi:hypothetical protein
LLLFVFEKCFVFEVLSTSPHNMNQGTMLVFEFKIRG